MSTEVRRLSKVIRIDDQVVIEIERRRAVLQTKRDDHVTPNDALRQAFGLDVSCGHFEYRRVKGVAHCAYTTCPNYYGKFVKLVNGRIVAK